MNFYFFIHILSCNLEHKFFMNRTGLSESHARLSMRDTVTFEDAVAAIFLYEESIGIIFGPSMYSKQPKRVIDSGDAVSIARQVIFIKL